MVDIRAEIDRLDRQVFALLGQRFAYVSLCTAKNSIWQVNDCVLFSPNGYASKGDIGYTGSILQQYHQQCANQHDP